ncbi:MAG: response regulator [Nitrospirae bacterium]|nr:MAG: response regulator [Nitrospirota bacterium]
MAQRNILVVDDSAMMRQLLTMTMRKALPDVLIFEAANGREALERIRTGQFDLVLTDMQMPEMNGRQLIEAVRKGLGSMLPIVVVTTQGEEQDRESGLASGADGYLTKPVKPLELRETVSRFLR